MIEADRYELEVVAERREHMLGGDFGWLKPYESLACNRGVWDKGHNFPASERHALLVERNRKNSCFYLRHAPGMSFPAAQKLQEHRTATVRSGATTRLTVYGLVVALVGVVLTLALSRGCR
jgi:hypothetical protein